MIPPYDWRRRGAHSPSPDPSSTRKPPEDAAQALREFGAAPAPRISRPYVHVTPDGQEFRMRSTLPEAEARAALAERVARIRATGDEEDARLDHVRPRALDQQLAMMAGQAHVETVATAPAFLVPPAAAPALSPEVMAMMMAMAAQFQAQASASNATSPMRDRPVGSMLSEAISLYVDYMAHRARDRPCMSHIAYPLQIFFELTGDRRTTDLTQRDADTFVDAVRRWPIHASKVVAYRNMRAPKVLQRAAERRDKIISTRTQQVHVDRVRGFFLWLENRREITPGLLAGVRLWKAQDNPGGHRLPFTEQQLQRIFSPFHVAKFDEPHMYWVPLLALYQGMRLTEVCQLYLSDVRLEGPEPCIVVSDYHDGQRLKTKSANRILPIHSKLLELGLADFVAQCRRWGRVRLFPGLTWGNKGPGSVMCHWFNTVHLRHTCGIRDRKLSFHSLRHNFATFADEADVPWTRIARLLGHKNEQAPTALLFYFRPRPIERAKDDLEAIRFPSIEHAPYRAEQYEAAFQRAQAREARAARLDGIYGARS